MKVPIIFTSGKVGYINGQHALDHLIQQKEIVAFRRSEGWVHIGCDPLRKVQQPLSKSDRRDASILKLLKPAPLTCKKESPSL